MNSDIESKLDKRLMRMATSPKPLTQVSSTKTLRIVSQRGYQGITGLDGTEIVKPVYDRVIADGESSVCGLAVDGKIALADTADGSMLTDFLYDSIIFHPDNHTVEIVIGTKHGLFDTVNKKIDVEPVDDHVAVNSGGSYTWSYTPGEGYTFHNTVTRHKIIAGNNIDLCFDEAYGHIFGIFDGRVSVVSEEGLRDDAAYRSLVARLNGRIELSNYDRGLHVVADIYGNVL